MVTRDDEHMSTQTRRLVGRLLVASPTLTDENFRRTVILMLDHGDDGALGLVVNRPMEVDVSTVLPAWQPYATAPGRLFQGGPVQLDSALGLVAMPGTTAEPVGVRLLIGSIGLVDLDAPPEVIVSGLAGLRIFAGYAGWAAGQLEGEISEGAWYVVDSEPRDAFTDSPQRLWYEVLRRQRGRLAMVSTYPDDPTQN
jgi:putative transcriptional regulator